MEKNANKIRRAILKKKKKLGKHKRNIKIVHNNFFINNNYYTQSINNYFQYYQEFIDHRISPKRKKPPTIFMNKKILNMVAESKIENLLEEINST